MGRPRKYPSDHELRRLYVDEDLSAYDIVGMYGGGDQSGFYKLLRKAGISVKKGNREVCSASGCTEPVYRITHTNNGSIYGTLCRLHWKRHRTKLSRDYQRVRRGITPDRYKPWERKDGDLTEYEKETLWIVNLGKELKRIRQWLRSPKSREVSRLQ